MGSAAISWFAPITNTDGSPLTDLVGYAVHYSRVTKDLNCRILIFNPSAITWTVDGLSPGTWYFAVSALNSVGSESLISNIASKMIQ
jgi:hypothetical protein